MTSFESFKKVIEVQQEASEYVDKLYDLKIDMIESPLYEALGWTFDKYLESNFNEEGCDTICWWMFEDGRDMTRKDGTPVKLDTVEDLWNALMEFECFK